MAHGLLNADAEASVLDPPQGVVHAQVQHHHQVGDHDAGGAFVAGLAEDQDLSRRCR